MLDRAIRYAEIGWKIFPLQPRSKHPFKGFRWREEATTDLEKVRKWWTDHPSANIAIVPGERGLVIDFDGRYGGTPDGLNLPETYTVQTADGVHMYYAAPAGIGRDLFKNLDGDIECGIDLKGTGTGYVLAPGSVHPSGAVYKVAVNAQIADLPESFIDRVFKPVPKPRQASRTPAQVARTGDGGPYWDKALTDELETVAAAPEGARNDTLNTAAFNLGTLIVAAGADPNDVADQLATVARGIGLEDREAEATIRSGLTAGMESPRDIPQREAPAPVVMATNRRGTLDELDAAARRWFGTEYDLDAMHAVLAAAAVERLDGDPVWLLLVSGSGNAKTETVQALDGAGGIITSTISSQGALLSATSRKERANDATGGLLRKIGDRGILVVKDVTSILSMSRDARAEVLGALREVYDGRWSRNVGTDGGKTLDWAGRIVVIGAVTTAWDRAHGVVASMGDRFVLVRMDSSLGRQAAGRRAIGNTGSETQMRAELSEAVCAVLNTVHGQGTSLTDDETDRLLAAADLVTLARTAVESDYQGTPEYAHDPEMPTRFAKQLAQLVRGAVAIGLDRDEGMRLAIRCARDSMPPLRLAIVDDVAAHPDAATREVRQRLDLPRNTVDRGLQALHMLGVLTVREDHVDGRGTVWRYSLAAGIEPQALKYVPDMALPPLNPQVRGSQGHMCRDTAKPGTSGGWS